MEPVIVKSGKSIRFCCKFEDIEGFKGFKDDVNPDQAVNKDFRWSTDGNSWSYWSMLTKQNIQNIRVDKHTDVWIEVKYTCMEGVVKNAIVSNLEFFPIFSEQEKPRFNYNTWKAMNSEDTSGALLEITPSSFKPYAINQENNIYAKLNKWVSSMFGQDATYFRAVPQDKSGDVIFKEWSLYNVQDPVCLKVMVPNNEMPDLNPQFNAFGVEYADPFEIEILLDEFREKFGRDACPQKGDIIYIPLISNRLYEVSSSVSNRGFMYKEISWKVALKKYSPASNRDLSEKALTAIDDLIESPVEPRVIQSQEDLFGETLKNNEEDLTVPQVLNHFNGTSKDQIRSYVSFNLAIQDFDFDNHGIKVANSFYDLSSMYERDGSVKKTRNGLPDDKPVIYSVIQNFKPGQDFAFTSWIASNRLENVSALVKSIKGGDLSYTITADKKLDLQPGDYIQCARQGKLSFYALVENVNGNSVDVVMTKEVLENLETISANWTHAAGYSMRKTYPKTLLDGYDRENNKGILLEMFCDRFFVFHQNDKEFLYNIGTQLNDETWYGVVLNYSMKFGQIALSVFELGTDVKSSDLRMLNTVVKNVSQEEIGLDEIQFVLRPSYHKQTNIRIYKETIPEEQMGILLNQFVISDSSKAVLVDNAVSLNRLAYIGNPK